MRSITRLLIIILLVALAPLFEVRQALAAPGDFLFQWGIQPLIKGADGVAVDPQGNLYVVDTGHIRVLKFGPAGNLLAQFPVPGATCPTALARDTQGNMFVADSGTNSIYKLDSSGNLMTSWGGYGYGTRQFKYLTALAVDSVGNVYAADQLNFSIKKYDNSGNFLLLWSETSDYATSVSSPGALTVDSNDNVYVGDQGGRLQKFTSSGQFLMSFLVKGSPPTNPQAISGVAVDSSGRIYVSQGAYGAIQIFDAAGTFVASFGSQGFNAGQFDHPNAMTLDSAGTIFVSDSQRVQKFSATGSYQTSFGEVAANGELRNPQGLSVDRNGNVFVADEGFFRIQKFDASGNFLAKWGEQGSGNGKFDYPTGVAVGGNDEVFVVDRVLVQKFDSNGQFLTSWPSLQSTPYVFSGIYGVATDPASNIFIADANGVVEKYDSSGNFLLKWGYPDLRSFNPLNLATDSGGNAYTVTGDQVWKFSGSGALLAQYATGKGRGLAIDGNGNIYLTQPELNRVRVFDSGGNLKGEWGTAGSGNGQFKSPGGIAINAAGTVVYVTDLNDRVQAFVGFGPSYTLEYLAGPNGSITGTARQIVLPDGSGSQVTAVANSGYQFISWSDGVTTAARTDYNVNANLSVTANFSLIQRTYTLTFAAGTGGTVSGISPQILWPGGWSSSVSAVPASGYHFVNWTGDNGFIATTCNPLRLQYVQAAYNITANFEPDSQPSSYTLTFTAGTGGTISGPSPQVLSPGASSVAVSAVAGTGYHFVNWTGTNGFVTTITNPLQLTNVAVSQTITANFAPDPGTYTLTFSVQPWGGLSGGTSPQVVIAGASSIPMTAVPADGYHFVNWTGDNGFVTTTVNPLVVTNVRANMNITANFALNVVTYTLTFQAGAGGSIGGGPAQQVVNTGASSMAMTAIPLSGYHFVEWTGDHGFPNTMANPLVVTNVSANHTITAHFAVDTQPLTYGLNFEAGAGGTVSGTVFQILYPDGWSSPVTAVANSGYRFVNWTGDNGFVATSVNPLQLQNVTSDYNIKANFVSNNTTYTLTFEAGPGGTISGTTPQILWPGGWSSAVKALPKSGYHFVNWTGDNGFVSTTANLVVITGATASQNLTAKFAPN
ncbi:hypothetical protein GMST_17100 [Geomonas silvestris]|uniref:Bacterial repeat domain-containing protein n=1 Tax=Geomonas silvestris TaxID=2740184 RepID=A0A6V8MHD2_9BACT|nr:InlB B-repeat-containing protein [Geomonas silvestris]GFO59385.1 hypothetical protein GMST_17100 [Geomonas silvestris]